jgi:hypothetical protein
MKQLLPTQNRKGPTPLILLGLLLTFQTGKAQEQNINVNNFNSNVNVNVRINPSPNNTRNINVVIPTQGPNGIGPSPSFNQINVIDNGTEENIGGPNVRGYVPAVIPKQTLTTQVANKPKTTKPKVVQTARPKPVVASSTAVQRPKPKPKVTTTSIAPRRTVARPAVPVTAVPVVAPPAAPQVQAPVSNPVIGTGNEQVVVQQEMNDDDVIAQPDAMPNVMSNSLSNVRANVPAPAGSAVSSSAVRRSAASGGSGSSGKSHRSGRKKHGSFSYNANKKLQKLFAQNRKGKFDPAKCFVWN